MRIADDSFQKLPFLGEINTHRMQFYDPWRDGSCSKQLPIIALPEGMPKGRNKNRTMYKSSSLAWIWHGELYDCLHLTLPWQWKRILWGKFPLAKQSPGFQGFRSFRSFQLFFWATLKTQRFTKCQKPRWGVQVFSSFNPIWGRWSNLTHVFQMGWNHRLAF